MTNPTAWDVAWLKYAIRRDNNFDLIRLLAALQVILWHALWHMKLPAPPWFAGVLNYFPGVPIFFFLSGVLVTYSLSSSASLGSFYLKRARRIFPALWLSFGVAVLLLIAFGQLSTHELKLPALWFWVATQVSFLQFYNPAFFRHFGTGVVNGSLWTISVEISFYIALPFIVRAAARIGAGRRNPRVVLEWIVVPGILLSYALSSYIASLGNLASFGPEAPLWARLVNQTFLPYFWLFGLGMLAYLRYGWLKAKLTRRALPLLAVYLAFSFIGDRFELFQLPVCLFISRILLCATILSFGASSKPIAGKILRGWDLSYGLYVFHMVVVNAFVALNYRGTWTSGLLMIGICISMAALSWNYVERPSIMATGALFEKLWKKRSAKEILLVRAS